MKINFKYSILISIIFIIQNASAQIKDQNIGSEVINVVKPYSPTISDAFKVKEIPNLDDDETAKKEIIQYNIFSFPVASVFTPSKGKAAGVDKVKDEKIFSNYLTLGAGNYGTVNAELFLTQTLENNDYVGVMLRHLSSQGGIKDVQLTDKFFNTSLDATYGSHSKNITWNADLGFQNQVYNWYGLQSGIFSAVQIDAINTKQNYNNAYFGARLQLVDTPLKDVNVKFNRFWDGFASAENHFVAKPNLEFDILDEKIKTNFIVDYISGSFKKDYYNTTEIKYGYSNFGFSPSFQIKKDDLAITLGATFFYSVANAGGLNKFFIYPNITASYKVVGDLMIAFAGAEGTLKQNSYQDFANANFFVSPTLSIAPTDQKYEIYAGLKGKLANSVAYNIRGSYLNEGNTALFKNNIYDSYNTNSEGYTFANSFDVVYDNIKTVRFFGELKADFSKNVNFGINGTFSSYSKSNEQEAWNLPTIKMGSTLDFNINPKWAVGANVFFVGQRKDISFIQDDTSIFPPTYSPKISTLDSYFDMNAKVVYSHNERLSFFLKGNNLANQNYQRWINYPVQGIQVIIGANYKFDF